MSNHDELLTLPFSGMDELGADVRVSVAWGTRSGSTVVLASLGHCSGRVVSFSDVEGLAMMRDDGRVESSSRKSPPNPQMQPIKRVLSLHLPTSKCIDLLHLVGLLSLGTLPSGKHTTTPHSRFSCGAATRRTPFSTLGVRTPKAERRWLLLSACNDMKRNWRITPRWTPESTRVIATAGPTVIAQVEATDAAVLRGGRGKTGLGTGMTVSPWTGATAPPKGKRVLKGIGGGALHEGLVQRRF